jgi:hypothetical protein
MQIKIAHGVLPITCILLAGCMGNGDPSHDGIFWNEKAAQARQATLLNQDRLSWAQSDAISSKNDKMRNHLADQKAKLRELQNQLDALAKSTDPQIASKAVQLQKSCTAAMSSKTSPEEVDRIISSIEAETSNQNHSS